jgi:hypothetical protein
MTLADWLKERGACKAALAWVRESGAETPAEAVTACPCGGWLLWLAAELAYSARELAAAVRPSLLRAAREYAPAALDAEWLHAHAAQLQDLPDDVLPETVKAHALAAAKEAQAACAARAARAAWAAWSAAAYAAEAHAECAAWTASDSALAAAETGRSDAEHARCAAEVRAAFPDLAARWSAAMEVEQ